MLFINVNTIHLLVVNTNLHSFPMIWTKLIAAGKLAEIIFSNNSRQYPCASKILLKHTKMNKGALDKEYIYSI